jgi:hypothetical protein
MAGRSQQSHAKRARELAVKERRERKRVKKAEAAAQRAAGGSPPAVDSAIGVPDTETETDTATADWIQ